MTRNEAKRYVNINTPHVGTRRTNKCDNAANMFTPFRVLTYKHFPSTQSLLTTLMLMCVFTYQRNFPQLVATLKEFSCIWHLCSPFQFKTSGVEL